MTELWIVAGNGPFLQTFIDLQLISLICSNKNYLNGRKVQYRPDGRIMRIGDDLEMYDIEKNLFAVGKKVVCYE